MVPHIFMRRKRLIFFPVFLLLFGLALQGCVATREWVTEQIDPLGERLSAAETRVGKTEARISDSEAHLGKTEKRVSSVEGRLSNVDGRLRETDARSEKVLSSLANLRLERRFVLDLKEGTNFAFNSVALNEEARRQIDSFLSDLKGDLEEMGSGIFLVAGHTDNVGSEDYNYELGKRRAESVARYLVTHKKLDPLKVMTVSYGKSAPLADNATREGRSKNRRVEILVFKEAIATSAAETGPRAEAKVPE